MTPHFNRIAPLASLILLASPAFSQNAKPATTASSKSSDAGKPVRGPYLQMPGPNRMTVRWRSTNPVAGVVRHGTAPDKLDAAVTEVNPTTEHVVELTGLTPATRYFYSIGSANDILAGGDAKHCFTTAPVPGPAHNTRIWVIGDAGTANTNQAAVRNAFITYTGSRTPDFWLMLGDNAYNEGTDAEYQAAVFNMYPSYLRCSPVWPTLGNHETAQSIEPNGKYPYFDMFTLPTRGECGGVASGTEHYYSFNYANIHFVCLDSMTANRSITGPMATWLKSDLASNTATWLIAFWHHPPYTKGSHDSDVEGELIQMRRNMLPILEGAGVDLVLSGHSHSYERSCLLDGHYERSDSLTPAMKKNPGNGNPNGDGAYTKPLTGRRGHAGAVYAVAGSSGKTSGGPLNHPAMVVSLNKLGSMILDISGNRLDATFLRENGSVDDSFSILKKFSE